MSDPTEKKVGYFIVALILAVCFLVLVFWIAPHLSPVFGIVIQIGRLVIHL